jgi:hypothetical protein
MFGYERSDKPLNIPRLNNVKYKVAALKTSP